MHYPGLPSHPRHAMVQELFSGKGCGGMFGFEVKDGPAADAVLKVGGGSCCGCARTPRKLSCQHVACFT